VRLLITTGVAGLLAGSLARGFPGGSGFGGFDGNREIILPPSPRPDPNIQRRSPRRRSVQIASVS
jgi:hypothetical protein